MRLGEVFRHKLVSAHRRDMKQFDEGHQVCVFGLKADARKAAMVELTITAILRQEKGMMDSVATPKGDTVLVILKQLREKRALVNVLVVVGVKSNEQELCLVR